MCAGEAHSLVVTDAGVLFGFGSNVNGQLGLGMADTLSHLPTPVSVAGEPVPFPPHTHWVTCGCCVNVLVGSRSCKRSPDNSTVSR